MIHMNKLNKKDINELLNTGISKKEIENLTKKGFTKEEMTQAHKYNNEIKKGSSFIAWIVDIITWILS
ncbi:hypothetical protein [uncultured Holdemanella sp.]|uniref:hypothetical protein n=1 Tax=uncultured Holdemanella sp. TaxID=1763549 RepID=UPI0025EDA9FC|nr:hypothetical protein [uncultured Holdemanella sp.]